MAQRIIVHTASIRIGKVEQIITASLKADDVRREVRDWRKKYPNRKVTYQTIVEDVER